MSRKSQLGRLVALLFIEAFTIIALHYILPGFELTQTGAVIFVLVVSFLNAYLRPFLIRVTFTVSLFTLGLFSLVINGVLIYFAAELVGGVEISNLFTAIVISLCISGVNALFSSIFAIDDDESYFRNVIKKTIAKTVDPIETDTPGVIFIEIDGLSHAVIQRAMQNAYMPNLAHWLRETHTLVQWECDLSSQTSASQAGILHGNNDEIPAFRFFDRNEQRVVTSSQTKDVHAIEERVSNANGLLAKGTSLNNMFSGDAENAIMTASQLMSGSLRKTHKPLQYFFLDPYNFSRMLFLSIIDIYNEIKDSLYQKRHDVYPRVEKEWYYPLMRAVMNVIMRELSFFTLISAMFTGTPAAYITFVGYDEVAHHSGVEREQAMESLKQLDKQFSKLQNAVASTPRPYHFVILSDHGQSQGATFEQRYGTTLEALIQDFLGNTVKAVEVQSQTEAWSHVNILLTQATQEDTAGAKALNKALQQKTKEGIVSVGPESNIDLSFGEDPDKTDAVVLASGNLGLIYFPGNTHRLTFEDIEERTPGIIELLIQHEGIGFIVTDTREKGSVVLGKTGKYYLQSDTVEGENPLARFGEHAVDVIKRNQTFSNAPDILVNSMYDVNLNEVAAFENLVGSHGGLGGNQSKPFLMYPKALEGKRLEGIFGAPALHKILKTWTESAL